MKTKTAAAQKTRLKKETSKLKWGKEKVGKLNGRTLNDVVNGERKKRIIKPNNKLVFPLENSEIKCSIDLTNTLLKKIQENFEKLFDLRFKTKLGTFKVGDSARINTLYLNLDIEKRSKDGEHLSLRNSRKDEWITLVKI